MWENNRCPVRTSHYLLFSHNTVLTENRVEHLFFVRFSLLCSLLSTEMNGAFQLAHTFRISSSNGEGGMHFIFPRNG